MLSLGRKVTVILLIKLIALTGIYYLFFGPGHRIRVNQEQVQTHFYSGESEKSSGER